MRFKLHERVQLEEIGLTASLPIHTSRHSPWMGTETAAGSEVTGLFVTHFNCHFWCDTSSLYSNLIWFLCTVLFCAAGQIVRLLDAHWHISYPRNGGGGKYVWLSPGIQLLTQNVQARPQYYFNHIGHGHDCVPTQQLLQNFCA